MLAELRQGQHPQLLSQLYWGRRVGATVCDCCAQAGRQTLLGALGSSKDVVVFHQITIPVRTGNQHWNQRWDRPGWCRHVRVAVGQPPLRVLCLYSRTQLPQHLVYGHMILLSILSLTPSLSF